MKNKADMINDLEKDMFLKASLILISEELRTLLQSATGLNNQYFRVFIASKDEENNTQIITCDNMKNQILSMRLIDALQVAQIQEINSSFPWRTNMSIADIQKILEKNDIYKSNEYFISDELCFPFGTYSNTISFYFLVMLRSSEWRKRWIPKSILKEYFDYFKQKIESFLKAKVCSQISEIISNIFNAESIVRKTCDAVLYEVIGAKKEKKKWKLFELICNLACKPYEGNQNKGAIRFSSDRIKTACSILLSNPVECTLAKAREIRKLLEMTSVNTSLIINIADHKAFGLGKKGAGDYFIKFDGNGRWKLFSDNTNEPVLSVEGTICTFISSIDKSDFKATFIKVFPEYEDYFDIVNNIIEEARKQKHGTSVVICDKAKEESERLGSKGRAIEIKPISLTKKLEPKQRSVNIFEVKRSLISSTENIQTDNEIIKKITSIDGALIISPEGECFAIGAILDGVATVVGDTGRGARYNSLNNYVKWVKNYYKIESKGNINAMAVVISEDQTIDFIPPNTKRSEEENNQSFCKDY